MRSHTASILAQPIYQEGSRLVAAGNPMALKRGVDQAVALVMGSWEAPPGKPTA